MVIVSHGRLALQTTLADLASRGGTRTGLRIRSPELPRLIGVLEAIPVGYHQIGPDVIVIDGATPEWFGPLAAQHQIVLYELAPEGGSLEDVFLNITHGFDAADPRLAAGQPPVGQPQPVGQQPQPVGYGPGATPMPGGPT